MKRFLAGLSGFLCSLLMLGCNQHGRPIEDFGIEKLTKGVSTEADVRQAMGEPEMVWNEQDMRTFEYPKGPEGHRTWMVELDAMGIVREYRQTLTDENFANIRAGMTRDEVRRLLGKPRSIAAFPLKNEEVWDWRYLSGPATEHFFNVHFDRDSGKVVHTSSNDPVKG